MRNFVMWQVPIWQLLALLVPLAVATPALASGAELFEANCSACHQSDGKGIPGAFPALAGDPFVLGDPAKPVAVVLAGRGGMPTFRDELTDAQIADILSFVRSHWGNTAPAITPEFVTATRGAKADATKPPPPLLAH